MIDFSKKYALIVENSTMMRAIISEMLRHFGVHEIVKVVNAEEAIVATNAQTFDFIILDFFLGTMDGGDFTRQLRRDETSRNRQTPILLVTAQPNHKEVVKARDCGINEMLAKPLSAKSLYARLDAMLARTRPFIVSLNYVGPCRRRRKLTPPGGVERRRKALVLDNMMPPEPVETRLRGTLVEL